MGPTKSLTFSRVFPNPDAPCMEYLPTLGEKWLHSRGNGWVNIPYMDPMAGFSLRVAG